MEKLVFKNVYLNAVFGGLLIALAILGYFLGFFADYVPIFTGAILILLSLNLLASAKLWSVDPSFIIKMQKSTKVCPRTD